MKYLCFKNLFLKKTPYYLKTSAKALRSKFTSAKMTAPKSTKVTFEQIDQHNIPPWPEWSDSYINSLQWNRPNKHFASVVSSTLSLKAKGFPVKNDECYEDPAGLLEMPSDIQVHSWKRPHQISPDISYVVELDPTPLDLVSHNKHLLDYEIMRTIISSLTCLERESFYRPFPIECQSDQFVANGGVEWKPWHHVYGLSQAGKGQVHHPQHNPHGKYVVRLFFLGKWRRILVDDRLPVDDQGQILLPMSRPDNLWLPLLSKALLKVACLSWQPPNHCVDFSVIHCVTGWIRTFIPCKGCSMYQLWCVCCQLMPTTEEVVACPGCCRSDLQLSSPLDDTTGRSAVGSRAILADIKSVSSHKGSTESSNIVMQTVLIGDVRYDSEQLTPLWKQYRWNEWAFNKGIISEIPHKPVRNIKIYNPLADYSELSTDISALAKNEVWLDFEEFTQYVRTLEVYYKPSYFKYSLIAWSENDLLLPPQTAEDVILKGGKVTLTKEKGGGDAKSTKSKATKIEKPEKLSDRSSPPITNKSPKGKGKDKRKGTEDERTLKEDWPKNLRKPSFFYLLMDSIASKGVLCNVSVYSPERSPYAIIFFGRFEWHSPSLAPIASRLSTTASSAKFFQLAPGLHVFRIWYQFPTYFCFQVFSNTPFQNGSKMSIQQSLTGDSMSYKYYGREISSSFEHLLAAPQGGADHGRAFQQLMSSLDPLHLSSQLPWPARLCAHNELVQAFEDSLTEMLAESIHHSEDLYQTIQAFQLLLLNPVFGMRILKSIKPEHYEYILEQKELQRQKDLLLEQELKEQSAQAMEQKGKKGSKSEKSKAKSKESIKTETKSKPAKTEKVGKKDKDKPKPPTQGEQLRKLIQCKEKNLLINDQTQAILLLKKMMSKVPHLRYLYPFNLEDDIKLNYRDYVGEVHATDKWVALVRCVFNIHSTEPVPCSLHIWSPVENLALRLIDNDSDEEVLPLGFVENNVALLSRNKEGYTVCAYGMVDHVKSIHWRLRSMGMRESDCLHLCKEDVDECTGTHAHIHPPIQFQQTLHGYYVPNKQNSIVSCLLEVHSDVTVLLRLHLSNKYSVCRLTVTDEDGEVVRDTSGTGEILLAVLQLKGREEHVGEASTDGSKLKPHVYRVAAEVLDNSWPLQPQQMKAMLYYKENLPAILDKLNENKSQERMGSIIETHNHSDRPRESPRKRSSRLERHSTIKQLEDPNVLLFENVPDKPSWILTLVSDLQEEMPVKLRLDTSLFEKLNELKTQWKDQGFNLESCRSLRQEFLNQLPEDSEDDFTEETVFKLKPKRLDKLTELYGRKVSDEWLQERKSPSASHVSSARSEIPQTPPSTLTSRQTIGTVSEPHESVLTGSRKSASQPSHSSTLKMPSTSAEAVEKLDHTNVLVQQAEIHKALQNIREKTLDHIQQIFKETADLRDKILNDMKMAKELANEQSKPDAKKGKKSMDSPTDKKGKKSKDLSPTDTKGKKTSVKDSKKPKGGKGKGK